MLASTSFCAAAPWKTEKFDTGVIVDTRQPSPMPPRTITWWWSASCLVSGTSMSSPRSTGEDDASDAPDVPATFSIDGVEISDVAFVFDDRSFTEGIVAYAKGQELPFEALRNAMASASSAIDLGYFDKRASFSSRGDRGYPVRQAFLRRLTPAGKGQNSSPTSQERRPSSQATSCCRCCPQSLLRL